MRRHMPACPGRWLSSTPFRTTRFIRIAKSSKGRWRSSITFSGNLAAAATTRAWAIPSASAGTIDVVPSTAGLGSADTICGVNPRTNTVSSAARHALLNLRGRKAPPVSPRNLNLSPLTHPEISHMITNVQSDVQSLGRCRGPCLQTNNIGITSLTELKPLFPIDLAIPRSNAGEPSARNSTK